MGIKFRKEQDGRFLQLRTQTDIIRIRLKTQKPVVVARNVLTRDLIMMFVKHRGETVIMFEPDGLVNVNREEITSLSV